MFSLFIGFDIRCWMFSLSIRELLIFCDPHQRIKANIEHSTSNVERSQNLGRIPRSLSGIAPMVENKQLHPIGWSCSKKLNRSERLSASRTGGDRRASPTQLRPTPAAQAWSAQARS